MSLHVRMKEYPWVEGYISYNKEGDRYEFEYADDGKVAPLLHENFELFEYRQCDGTWAKVTKKLFHDLKYDGILIPITSEILEKNGFVKRETYIWNNPEMRCTAYRFGRKHWDIRVTSRVRAYRPTRVNIENILYVHELQHALRLAGVEKEIEL